MRKYIHLGCIVFALLWSACNRDHIMRYNENDAALNFTTPETNFSFLDSENKESAIVEVPVQIMGPSVDYDRTFAVSVIDTSTTATPEAYKIVEASVKANEMIGTLKLEVLYAGSLDTSEMRLALKFADNEDFTVGYRKYFENGTDKLYPSHAVTWSNMLVKPVNFRSWWFWFSDTYSRDLHLLILEVLGEGAENINWYYELGNDENGNRIPKSDANECYALNRKLRKYVADYNAANPTKKLKHSKDALYYKTWNAANPEAVGEKEISIIVR